MTAYNASPTAGTFTRFTRRTLAAIAGGSFVVALVAGIGAWQRAETGTSTAAVEQAPPAAAAAAAARVRPADNILTVSIVDSQEEKFRLERALDEANTIRALQGDLLLENQVVVVAASSEEADRIVQAYSGHQDGLGQPVKFNDFRTRSAAPAAAPAPELLAPNHPAFVP